MNAKAPLTTILAYLSPLGSSLKVLFAPEELSRAFASSVGASGLVGFAAAFLTAVGTDAGANTSAGVTGAVVSYVLLTVAAKLKSTPVAASIAKGHEMTRARHSSRNALAPRDFGQLMDAQQRGLIDAENLRRLAGLADPSPRG